MKMMTMISLSLKQDPLDRGTSKVFKSKQITFEFIPGITALVGCNGSGKTTVISCLETYCKNKNIPIYCYKQTEAKDKLSRQLYFQNQLQYMLEEIGPELSEGETIYHRLSLLASDLGRFAKENKSARSIVFTFDSLDSGWSIDQIDDFCNFVENGIIPNQPKDQNVYVIIAANMYEFASLSQSSIDVQTGKSVAFDSYESYKKFILKSRKQKEKLLLDLK